jgi:hypothetical protein
MSADGPDACPNGSDARSDRSDARSRFETVATGTREAAKLETGENIKKREKKVHTSSYRAAGQVCISPALQLLRQGIRAVLTPNARKNFGRPKAADLNRGNSRVLSSQRA